VKKNNIVCCFDQNLVFFSYLWFCGGLNEILYTPVDIGLRVTNEFGDSILESKRQVRFSFVNKPRTQTLLYSRQDLYSISKTKIFIKINQCFNLLLRRWIFCPPPSDDIQRAQHPPPLEDYKKEVEPFRLVELISFRCVENY
jgi:hypothetical protein